MGNRVNASGVLWTYAAASALALFSGAAWAAAPNPGKAYAVNGRILIPITGSDYIVQSKGPDDADWMTEKFGASNDFFRSDDQTYEGPRQWRIGTKAEPHEWTDLGTINARHPLTGTAFSNGKYNDNCTADKAFDGKPYTYYEPGSSPYYVGLDFGEAKEIASVAYVPRTGFGDRVKSGWVEISETADFDNPTTICTLPADNASFTLSVIRLEKPVEARYVRFRTTQWMNIAELEFSAPETGEAAEAADLSDIKLKAGYKRGDGIYHAQLAWEPVNAKVTVKGATSVEGPWTDLAELEANAASFEYAEAPIGRPYFYCLASGPYRSSVVSFTQLRKIPFTGCTFAWQGNQDWGEHPGSWAFDGNLENFVDLNYANTVPKLAVDFGTGVLTQHVAQVLIYPRVGSNEEQIRRLNNAHLYGSTRSAEDEMKTDDLAAQLSLNPVGTVWNYAWQDIACDPTFSYRTYYLGNCIYANVTEIEFYGWYDSDVEGFAAPLPTAIAGLSVLPTDLKDFYASFNWQAFAGTARLERSVNGGAWTTLATVDGPNRTYVDRDEFKVGVLRRYRLVSAIETSAEVSFRKMRKLSFEGATIFGNGGAYDANGSWEMCFDGNLNTRCDLWDGNNNRKIKVGVDFGEATNYVGLVRIHSRKDGFFTRLEGAMLFGGTRASEDEANTYDREGAAALTDALAVQDVSRWYEVLTPIVSGEEQAFRTYFLSNMKEGGGNIAEIEFYGWTKADLRHGFMVLIQ